MMQLVKQRSKHDCGVACLAMLLDCPYEVAAEALGRDVEQLYPDVFAEGGPQFCGVLMPEIAYILTMRRIPCYQLYLPEAYTPEIYALHQLGVLMMPKLADLACHLDGGGTALVGVDSRNYPDLGHWVVASGCEIYDPSNNDTYSWGDHLPIAEALIVNRKE